ncbi:phenylpropionate dioxygenase-like ring-hydroxylating dioxygenase large terminal subunit [Haloferula luteola]|uniref:Phenylpropionate dioxygenase-like ring-hydroxylating dioxygenase large terminal subunit n=1 Tax=Haloferula luteola TaxID=595692 RepID=A0A840V0R4_9BACT|nr:aromatic ring-hydroxylating dioxygenase subunit alpha [Haloferula luteola]MBB5350923.1 phenylpropionate dioxygenase-like ring-hydroxylating dioxygenase large terminal subunit [Haloferula luteola]
MMITSCPTALTEGILQAAALPRERSCTLPAAAYFDADFARFEEAEVFRKEWISLCHVSQIPNAGDFVRIDLCGEPLLVVRGKDGEVRVLSRTCRHRGMDLMPSGFGHPDEGHQRVILCPYHLWSYDLGGKLIGAPEMQMAEGFDRSEVCLHAFRSAIWEGFVMVNLSGEADPIEERWSRLKDQFVGKWQMGEGRVAWSAHWECPFNWKILVENFMEAYHHMGAHMKTLEPFLPARGCWTEPYDPEFSVMHLPLKGRLKEEILERGAPETAFPVFPGLKLEDCLEWWIFLGFPNFLLFSAPDRVYWYRLLPTGPETCSLLTTMILAPGVESPAEEVLQREIQAGIDFHLEDMEVCTATQRGLHSSGYAQGRLSHLEEPIWHFQKYLAKVIQRAGGRSADDA